MKSGRINVGRPWSRALTAGVSACLFAFAMLDASAALAAAPWAFILRSEDQGQTAYLWRWEINQELERELANSPLAPRGDLGDRPYWLIRSFEGPQWSFVESMSDLTQLQFSQGTRPGRFYPPHRGRPAVLYGKVLSDEALRLVLGACVLASGPVAATSRDDVFAFRQVCHDQELRD